MEFAHKGQGSLSPVQSWESKSEVPLASARATGESGGIYSLQGRSLGDHLKSESSFSLGRAPGFVNKLTSGQAGQLNKKN